MRPPGETNRACMRCKTSAPRAFAHGIHLSRSSPARACASMDPRTMYDWMTPATNFGGARLQKSDHAPVHGSARTTVSANLRVMRFFAASAFAFCALTLLVACVGDAPSPVTTDVDGGAGNDATTPGIDGAAPADTGGGDSGADAIAPSCGAPGQPCCNGTTCQ